MVGMRSFLQTYKDHTPCCWTQFGTRIVMNIRKTAERSKTRGFDRVMVPYEQRGEFGGRVVVVECDCWREIVCVLVYIANSPQSEIGRPDCSNCVLIFPRRVLLNRSDTEFACGRCAGPLSVSMAHAFRCVRNSVEEYSPPLSDFNFSIL